MSWCETCCEGMISGIWKPSRGEGDRQRESIRMQEERKNQRGKVIKKKQSANCQEKEKFSHVFSKKGNKLLADAGEL